MSPIHCHPLCPTHEPIAAFLMMCLSSWVLDILSRTLKDRIFDCRNPKSWLHRVSSLDRWDGKCCHEWVSEGLSLPEPMLAVNDDSCTQKFMGTEVEGINLYTCNFLIMVDVGSKTTSSKLLRPAAFFFSLQIELLQIEWLPLPCFTRCILKFFWVKGRPYLPPSCQICRHTPSVRCVWLLKVNGRQSLKKQGRWERRWLMSWWVGSEKWSRKELPNWVNLVNCTLNHAFFIS